MGFVMMDGKDRWTKTSNEMRDAASSDFVQRHLHGTGRCFRPFTALVYFLARLVLVRSAL